MAGQPPPPLPLTVLADITAEPRIVVTDPRAVSPEIQGLLPGEGPPGLGWAEKQGGNGKVGGAREPVGKVRTRAWCREGAELGQNVDLVRKGKAGGGWRHPRQRLGEEGGRP